ncbi:uncharacterized protein LOC105833189 [Monomorium pharaonis]|uniref:uncharacterized protein LOC105833189 n=1 Tax=Monomorium pharaonis TaxID=307658 RepID=UPI00063ED523|nr:uncharacterized protein LOC105833189 [Monomorium pharaonis]
MLKHILTGQPSSTGSRHNNDYQTSSGSLHGEHHHHHLHNSSLHQDQQQQQQQPQPQSQSQSQSQQQPQQQQQQHLHHHHFTGSTGTRGGLTRHRGNNGGGIDVYDSVVARPTATTVSNAHQSATTPSSTHRHPLNHSQLSVNNLLTQRLNHSHALNVSTLSTSKHSVNSVSPVGGVNGNGNNNNNNNSNNHNVSASQLGHTVISQTGITSHQDRPKANGGFDISRLSRLPSQTTPSPAPAATSALPIVASQVAGGGPTVIPLNASWSSSLSRNLHRSDEAGVKEMLTSLGLLCLVSLLLALLSVIFLLKISPLTVTSNSLISPEEFVIVYEVTLALCALALSLNLCCLLVCAIQFLFAVKLVKTSYQGHRSNKYLQKSSISRVCAVGGFFISIPVFLTGMILYTFIQFHSTPAIVTSVFIGLGIVFCGCAMVHNVFVWQKEKTNAVKAFAREQCEVAAQLQRQQQQLQLQQPHHQQVHSQHHHQHHHQQQQHHHQQQLQLRPTLHIGSKFGSSGGVGHSNVSLAQLGRGGVHHPSHQHHPHQHHSHQQRHVSSMSPPLLLSSPHAASQHNHQTHRGGIAAAAAVAVTATPPTTPGDRSPPSPNGGGGGGSGKLNRSQHLPREASGSVSPGLPTATLDLSSAATTNSPHELSTLV